MFTNFKQIKNFFNERKSLGIKPGLDRINQLLTLMNHPEEKMKAIHIAGTNGKGSTISFLKNALIKNNYKVGTFISPSLGDLTGHIFCNDEKITTDQFIILMNQMYPAINQLDEADSHPTEFEIITVLAFMFFAHHVDITLIETGMGGRQDTTNCFTPILSIITNVHRDHTDFLGETVQEIAHHKAGIIKDNVPVIIGKVTESIFTVLQEEAKLNDAPIYRLFEHFTYTSVKRDREWQSFIWSKGNDQSFEISLYMRGNHQMENSSLAIMALIYLKKQGYIIDDNKMLIGMKETIVPGRFEVIRAKPQIVLDGAHNPASVQAFIETISLNEEVVDKHLIFAAFKDKDLEQMLTQLAPYFLSITLTSFDHPRAANAQYLHQLIIDTHKNIYVNNDWETVMNEVVQISAQDTSHYYVTGSLHFIACVRTYFQNHL